jgi:hypothetical protein
MKFTKGLLLLILVFASGCKTVTAPPVPLAPGYQNSIDQQLGETLASANAFYNKLQTNQKAGLFSPTAIEVTALNALQSSLTVANPVYLAYHNGTGTQASAQTAIANVTSAQTNVQNLLGGK